MWAYVFEINIRATQKKSSGCCWCSPQFFEVAESHERNCQLMSSLPVSRPWGSNRDGLDQDKRKLWVQWKETFSAHLGVPAELREASVPENTGEKTDQVPFSPRHSLRELTPSSLRGDHVCKFLSQSQDRVQEEALQFRKDRKTPEIEHTEIPSQPLPH